MRKFEVVSDYEPSGDQVSKSASVRILNPSFAGKTRPVKTPSVAFCKGIKI